MVVLLVAHSVASMECERGAQWDLPMVDDWAVVSAQKMVDKMERYLVCSTAGKRDQHWVE